MFTRHCVMTCSLQYPPCAESPFAHSRCYLFRAVMSQAPRRKALPLLHRSYRLMCQTKSLPPSSAFASLEGPCRLSPVPAGSWPFPTLSLQSLRRCLDPYPAVSSRRICSLLPRRQRPHVRRQTFGTPKLPLQSNFNREVILGAAVIL
jgi:hypothetical protein